MYDPSRACMLWAEEKTFNTRVKSKTAPVINVDVDECSSTAMIVEDDYVNVVDEPLLIVIKNMICMLYAYSIVLCFV